MPSNATTGLSPHARGNRNSRLVELRTGRSIPARAGQPSWRRLTWPGVRVYPRTRGATAQTWRARRWGTGLSPHARGNPADIPFTRARMGSIPARAGQPCPGPRRLVLRGVYPRTRGATAETRCSVVSSWGLSPHARGNHLIARHSGGTSGSIPARAGQPRSPSSCSGSARVYPRTRGATEYTSAAEIDKLGLSPHARGNQPTALFRWNGIGSIPARAGQPASEPTSTSQSWVYPRTRGATVYSPIAPSALFGLSPHARGNHPRVIRSVVSVRSIPARAGQPISAAQTPRSWRVYPRTRGATGMAYRHTDANHGLSPHARGNPITWSAPTVRPRSIPARAGQPYRVAASSGQRTVYPRTRGATATALRCPCPVEGLSPHARGNRRQIGLPTECGGSIPARAGQPMPLWLSVTVKPVYPRTRGATPLCRHSHHHHSGLSPHARGNPLSLA